jgi:hypothetical protein
MSEFDELLDGLLREGNNVEPPLGMERRVLARVRETAMEPVSGRRLVSRQWWGFGGAVAAGLVVLGLWMPKVFQKRMCGEFQSVWRRRLIERKVFRLMGVRMWIRVLRLRGLFGLVWIE